MQANTLVSVYTFLEPSARSIAQEASYHDSPIWEGAEKIGYFNHYHTAPLVLRMHFLDYRGLYNEYQTFSYIDGRAS